MYRFLSVVSVYLKFFHTKLSFFKLYCWNLSTFPVGAEAVLTFPAPGATINIVREKAYIFHCLGVLPGKDA